MCSLDRVTFRSGRPQSGHWVDGERQNRAQAGPFEFPKFQREWQISLRLRGGCHQNGTQ